MLLLNLQVTNGSNAGKAAKAAKAKEAEDEKKQEVEKLKQSIELYGKYYSNFVEFFGQSPTEILKQEAQITNLSKPELYKQFEKYKTDEQRILKV